MDPSAEPTRIPSFSPSLSPVPSGVPTAEPSKAPSLGPSLSARPSGLPSGSPSFAPSSCPAGEWAQQISFEDFEGRDAATILSGWTNGLLNSDYPGVFSQFLGQYGSAQSALMPSKKFEISASAAHVVLIFDVYELDNWEDSRSSFADYFELRMSDGTNSDSFRLEFAEDLNETVFAGTSNGGAITWSMENQPRDFLGFVSGFKDQIHTVTVVIPASFFSSNGLFLEFYFRTTAGFGNESGGIDNLRVLDCFASGASRDAGASRVAFSAGRL